MRCAQSGMEPSRFKWLPQNISPSCEGPAFENMFAQKGFHRLEFGRGTRPTLQPIMDRAVAPL
ncbi:hypothetical protein DA792_09805 [Celeribacter baekdonensis]|uniref:Uncharacterized protein n=1 Tax=Celeribacter baekdonensis TaxID=875171 RepID=A0A2R4M2J6_9RHOB|nr:hypothetical protein DA792_09805 [Celeribacter baekdonensis]